MRMRCLLPPSIIPKGDFRGSLHFLQYDCLQHKLYIISILYTISIFDFA
jgi:hypothetical protein